MFLIGKILIIRIIQELSWHRYAILDYHQMLTDSFFFLLLKIFFLELCSASRLEHLHYTNDSLEAHNECLLGFIM